MGGGGDDASARKPKAAVAFAAEAFQGQGARLDALWEQALSPDKP